MEIYNFRIPNPQIMPHSICYISNATTLLDEFELRKLFNFCRVENKHRGITGILIYKEGTFIQLLEGDESEISSLFEYIILDSRHNQITKVLDRSIKQNIFKDYKTGFGSFFNDFELHDLDDFIEEQKNLDYGRSVKALLQPFVALLA